MAADRTRHQKLTDLAAYRELRDAGAFLGFSMPAPLLSIASDTMTPQDAALRIEGAVLEAVQGRSAT